VFVFERSEQKQSSGTNCPYAILGSNENGATYFKQNLAVSALVRRIIVRTVYPAEFKCT
jgi:hypothetical protein